MVCNPSFFVILAALLLLVTVVGGSEDVDLSFSLTVHSSGQPNEACSAAEIDQVEQHLIEVLNGLTPQQLGISSSPHASFEVTSLDLDNYKVSTSPNRNRLLSLEYVTNSKVSNEDVSSSSDLPATYRRRLWGYWYFGGYGRCGCCYCRESNADHDYLRRGLYRYWNTSPSSRSRAHTGSNGAYTYARASGSSTNGSASATSSSTSSTFDTDSSTVTYTHSSATSNVIEDGATLTSSSSETNVAITLAADLENELGSGHCMAGDTYSISIDFHDD